MIGNTCKWEQGKENQNTIKLTSGQHTCYSRNFTKQHKLINIHELCRYV